jgi:hypothetical protein
MIAGRSVDFRRFSSSVRRLKPSDVIGTLSML